MEEVLAVDLDGRCEVAAPGQPGLGWATEWLPDGRMLITGKQLLRREHDGTFVPHVDLSDVSPYGCSEIVVDGRGNIYVNSICFDFIGGEEPKPGIIVLITPDGSVQQVADGIQFPNGMVVTPDNRTLIVSESFTRTLLAYDIAADGTLANRRVWADGLGPDGICLDTDGCIWTGTADGHGCVRVREGGEILQQIALDKSMFACMLGGPDRRTLFMLVADWSGTDNAEDNIAKRTGEILVMAAPAPGTGWP